MADTTPCVVCGNPCHKWGPDSQSACQHCAADIHNNRRPEYKRTPESFMNGGDGFPISDPVWSKSVQAVKDYFKANKTNCYVCGVPTKSFDNYAGDNTGRWASVCAKCYTDACACSGRGTTPKKEGTGLVKDSYDWKEPLEKIKARHESKKIIAEVVAGDRVVVSIKNHANKITLINATVVAKSPTNQSLTVALDRAYSDGEHASSSWESYTMNYHEAVKLGVNTTDATHWLIGPNELSYSVITSILKKKDAMAKIETLDLIEGDRIEIEIRDISVNGGKSVVKATFLTRDNDGDAIVALDKPYSTSEYDGVDWDDHVISSDILRAIAARCGVTNTVSSKSTWTIEKNASETKILKVLSHQAKKDKDKKMPMDRATGMTVSWKDIIAKDSAKAAVRSGATLGIDGLKAGITKFLESQGMNSPGIQGVLDFLATPIGDAILRGGLGYTLLGMPIPYIQENEYAQQISEELRVSGIEGGLDQAAAIVKTFIAPAVMEAFKGTPMFEGIMKGADPKARIAEVAPPQRVAAPAATVAEAEAEELEVVADPFKAPMQARA